MSTNDATDNVFSISNPQVITQDSIPAGDSAAGGNTPRIFPRQNLTGNQRGVLNITGQIIIANPDNNTQDIILDGTTGSITIGSSTTSNVVSNGINVVNTDGSRVGMGAIPDGSGDFGFYAQDGKGNLLYKIVGSTIYTYDITQNPVTNNMQLLKLPDGTYGLAIAKPGFNVSDGITS